jgi:hypothetical protein
MDIENVDDAEQSSANNGPRLVPQRLAAAA